MIRYLQFSIILIIFLQVSLTNKKLTNKKKLAKIELNYYLNINRYLKIVKLKKKDKG